MTTERDAREMCDRLLLLGIASRCWSQAFTPYSTPVCPLSLPPSTPAWPNSTLFSVVSSTSCGVQRGRRAMLFSHPQHKSGPSCSGCATWRQYLQNQPEYQTNPETNASIVTTPYCFRLYVPSYRSCTLKDHIKRRLRMDGPGNSSASQ